MNLWLKWYTFKYQNNTLKTDSTYS